MTTGIYWIRNIENNHVYVGSSNNIEYRWTQHRASLRHNHHDSKHLQFAWNKYGEGAFEFEVILICDKSMLRWYEQQFLDQWKPEYNTSPSAGGFLPGHEHSKRTIKKIKEARKHQIFPVGHYERLGKRFTGENNPAAKLTEAQVIKIKKKLQAKENQYHIAAEFGVTQSMISLISRGIKWSSVEVSND